MTDKKTIDLIQQAHPAVRKKMLDAYAEMCESLTKKSKVRFVYVMRTFAEQAALYAQGRKIDGEVNALRKIAKMNYISSIENKSKVTNAPAGMSIHNYGLAFDIVLLIDRDNNGTYETASWDTMTDFDGDGVSDWMECVKIAKRHGFVWGGDFKSICDMPHFEMTFGWSPSELLKQKISGKVDKDGYVLI